MRMEQCPEKESLTHRGEQWKDERAVATPAAEA